MKYIMFECSNQTEGTFELELPIIFPNLLVHSQVAVQMDKLLRLMNFKRVHVCSGGDYNPDTCQCSGKSETLNVKARSVDSIIIRTSINA